MHAKHTDASQTGLSGSGVFPTSNTGWRQTSTSAAAGPGPSTVAAARRHGRKIPASSSSMAVIELTDSEDGDNLEERNPKRARNTAMMPRTPLRQNRATNPSATSSTSSRRATATGAKAVHLHVGGSSQGGGGKDNDKENAAVPVTPFMDDDSKEEAGGHGHRVGDVLDGGNDDAKNLPLVPQQTTHDNEEQALAEHDEDAPNDVQVELDLPGGPVPPPQEHPQGQLDHFVQQQLQQHEAVLKDGNDVSPHKEEAKLVEDIVTTYMAQVLDILPDIDSDYLLALILQLHPQHAVETVNVALTMLFDDPAYPKVDRSAKAKGKRKSDAATDDHRPVKKVKVDYVDYSRQDREFRGGKDYMELAVEHLQISFPYMPRPYIRKILIQHRLLYAPTHVFCVQLYKQRDRPPKERPALNANLPFAARKTPYKPSSVQKINDAEFEKEKRWVQLYDSVDGDLVMVRARFMAGDDAMEGADEVDEQGNGKGKQKETNDEEEGADDECPEGEGIECGCCFTEYSFEKMIQCPEAHLFCKSCIKSYASNLLGLHDIRLKCMHQSGCTLLFPESELRRVLPQKLIDLYDRLKQKKEIEDADLEGLEECPFCDYKCVIEVDNTQEKLFRCGNFDGGCGAISCRECKRLDHLPKSCKEMDQERVLNGQHAIEEAMSAALMRSCPKCKKPFVKEAGCNKITCYTCATTSCYVCRKIITGYDHFDQTPGGAPASTSKASSKKCPLWEPVDTRHAQEVSDAAAKALADFRAEHPDVDHDGIKVDVPKVPEAPAQPGLLRPQLLLPPLHQIAHVPINPAAVQLAAAARGRGRGNGRGAQPQPQPVQPLDPHLHVQLGHQVQPVLPNVAAGGVGVHHHHHHHHHLHHHIPLAGPQPAGAVFQNPAQAVPPLAGGGQVPQPVPMAAVPQAPAFAFHFPANLGVNNNPAVQLQQQQQQQLRQQQQQQLQPQNLLPIRQNPPRRGRYVPPAAPAPNVNMNVNPNPIRVQVQNQPAQRQRARR